MLVKEMDSSETDTRGLTPPFLWSILSSVQTKHMSSNTTTVNSGMGFAGWLTILFVGLKLTGFISWPWIWVISPIWISFLIALGFLAIILGIAVVSGIWK
jgi:hypothetical protein